MESFRILLGLLFAVFLFAGCATPSKDSSHPNAGTLSVRIEKVGEHFGHSFAEVEDMHVHPDWIDGCVGRLVSSGEIFAIWWNNNEIKDMPWRFEKQKTYVILYQGEIGNGVMAYEGKSLNVRQIVKMEEDK